MSHARLGPSNHRWVHCPGSVREEAKYPDISGDAAIDGTGSHLLLELCLNEDKQAQEYLEEQIGVGDPEHPQGWTVYSDRIERVQMCLDYINRRKFELGLQFPGAKIVVEAETKANPGGYFGRDDWWGTVDITILVLNPDGGLHFIEIVDYKDGRGWVNEEDNSQLLAYCGGKMRPYVGSGPDFVRPFRTERVGGCRMTIVQPKTNPVVRYQEVTSSYVMDKLIELDQAADLTDKDDAPLVPGKHCQWCKHKPNCVARVEEIDMSNLVADQEFLAKVVTDVTSVPINDLTKILDAKKTIEDVMKKVEEEVLRRLEMEEDVPGYALKPGHGSKVWNDTEEEIGKKLKGKRLTLDEYMPRKMATPAQILKIEKLSTTQKKKIEEELITFKAGKLKAVKVEQEKQSAEMMFADVQPKEISFL